jgi:hypothetical protein
VIPPATRPPVPPEAIEAVAVVLHDAGCDDDDTGSCQRWKCGSDPANRFHAHHVGHVDFYRRKALEALEAAAPVLHDHWAAIPGGIVPAEGAPTSGQLDQVRRQWDATVNEPRLLARITALENALREWAPNHSLLADAEWDELAAALADSDLAARVAELEAHCARAEKEARAGVALLAARSARVAELKALGGEMLARFRLTQRADAYHASAGAAEHDRWRKTLAGTP